MADLGLFQLKNAGEASPEAFDDHDRKDPAAAAVKRRSTWPPSETTDEAASEAND